LSEHSIIQTKSVQFTAPPIDSFVSLTASFDEPELEHTPIAERWWHDPDQHTGVSHALCGLEKDIEADTEAHLSAADKHPESDVWGEPLFLAFLQTHEYPIDTTDQQKHLYRKRAKSYRTWEDKIYKVDGVEREVPKIEDRIQLIKDSHKRTGHFGQHRTLHLLSLKYW
jgi:hypothetical protein